MVIYFSFACFGWEGTGVLFCLAGSGAMRQRLYLRLSFFAQCLKFIWMVFRPVCGEDGSLLANAKLKKFTILAVRI